MRAEIVSVGTELLLGSIVDTNAAYLAQRLAGLGIDCYYVSQVGDNLTRLTEILGRAMSRSELVITTGGLGPTQDDLTREAISALLDEPMEVQPELEVELRSFFRRRGAEMPAVNIKQATLIRSAGIIKNPVGTAPGWWVKKEIAGRTVQIVSMPGVPYEMKRMWENEVENGLAGQGGGVIASLTLKTLGLGESATEDKVRDLMSGSNPTLAPYAKQDGVHLRITAKAADLATARQLIGGLEAQVRERLGDTIYGADDDTPQSVVRNMLQELGQHCALLEVGGLVAGSISSLLRTEDVQVDEEVVGSVSVGSLTQLPRLVPNSADGSGELKQAAADIARQTGATLVLAVRATQTEGQKERGAARVQAEICLLSHNDGDATDFKALRQSWKTDPAEVRRLVGLAAFNVLRLRLLEMKGQATI